MDQFNSSWEYIEKTGSFDVGLLLDAAYKKFKIHLKEADSNHLLVDQLSQLQMDISEFPRPRSPIRFNNDFLKDDINEPAVLLGSSFLKYGTRVSIISAFAALDDFLLAVSICFEALDGISDVQPFTLGDLKQAHMRGFKRAHKTAASEELIQKLGSKYINPKSLEIISGLKSMRNCVVHRWGIVANKDLNSEDRSKFTFEYLDHGVSKHSVEFLNYKKGESINHLQKIKKCTYSLNEEIIFDSIECQKILITLDILVRDILRGTLQWCKDTGKAKEVKSDDNE